MTPAQHLTWDSRPGADGTNVHLPKYSEGEAAEVVEPTLEAEGGWPECGCCCHDDAGRCQECLRPKT